MALAQILVVDDEPLIRETLAEFLEQEHYAVRTCGSGEEAVAAIRQSSFDVVLCDVNLPGIDGLEVLERISKISPETFLLLITAYATVETAIEAFHKGASDYLMKPIILHEVLEKIRRLMRQRALMQENQLLRRELHRETETREMIVGTSPAMRATYDLARKVGPTPSTVLILGESGTGKELLARAVHRFASGTNDHPFLAINCADANADRTDVFLHAGSGTVFLDEIGELPLSTQTKLLRTIEQKEIFPTGAKRPQPIRARIIAATNKDLTKEVDAGRFRNDLFYRLNVVTLKLPPLRDRREDIPELADYLLAKHVRATNKRIAGIDRDAMQILLGCSWKGNIRELDNALQRAVIFSDGPLLRVGDLPPDMTPQLDDPFTIDSLNEAVDRFEKLHIERILRQSPDKREAANRLGIGISSLYRKIEQLRIEE